MELHYTEFMLGQHLHVFNPLMYNHNSWGCSLPSLTTTANVNYETPARYCECSREASCDTQSTRVIPDHQGEHSVMATVTPPGAIWRPLERQAATEKTLYSIGV